MAYEQKPNTGSLFKAKERASDRHPEYSGSFNIDGKEYWLSGWVKESASGTKYFSLAVKPKEAKQEPKKVGTPGDRFGDMASDIPFMRLTNEYAIS